MASVELDPEPSLTRYCFGCLTPLDSESGRLEDFELRARESSQPEAQLTVWIHLGRGIRVLRTRGGEPRLAVLSELLVVLLASPALLSVGCCLDARAEEL